MVLSDRDIIKRVEWGSIEIDPFDEELVEPASVDLHLGSDFKHVRAKRYDDVPTLDTVQDSLRYFSKTGSAVIRPGNFVLATTDEVVKLPDDISATVLGRSSLGRLGISVHQTAGYIDPGFEGEITLELSNHGPVPVELQEGQRVCQIVFHELSSGANKVYGHERSQYQNQTGATPSGGDFD